MSEENVTAWAEVLVDVRVAQVDHPFHYAIPAGLQGRLQIGHRVFVPFGSRRRVEGFVVGFSPPAIPLGQVKCIEELVDELPAFSKADLAVAEWMAEQYFCLQVHAIRCFLPPGSSQRRRRPVRTRTVTGVRLELGAEEALSAAAEIESRAPRQAEVLRRLVAAAEEMLPLQEVSSRGAAPVHALAKRGWVTLLPVRRIRRPGDAALLETGDERPVLTGAQQEAVATATATLDAGGYASLLLHGVTGSGKTEVYLRVIEHALRRGRQAILLVPEISLTPQTAGRFQRRFGDRVAVLHSALSEGERYDEWRRIREGEADVVVGARSAVFAPLPRLGLVIIDEEHEASYKQEEAPRYHAREVAEQRLRRLPGGGLLLLGSATPSLESFHAALRGVHRYVTLPDRVAGRPLPRIEIVDMREELLAGNRSMFSRVLRGAITDALAKGEQVILLLNRRGYASFLLCRSCGAVPRCTACGVSLTYHQKPDVLRCHYCGYTTRLPDDCPQCRGPYLRPFGAGTQRVEDELKVLFPGARILRMDRDTTARKGAHAAILRAFAAGEADILVGTQMIAKGHDFPGVTLVGVLSADTALHFPDFRAAERTFQLLSQVAGRAGRGDQPGIVYLQTYTPDHYAIQAAAEHDFHGFARRELRYRRRTGYPPFHELVRVLVSGEDEKVVAEVAGEAARGCLRGPIDDRQLVGPSPAPLDRLKGKYRWHFLIKGERQAILKSVRQGLEAVRNRPADVLVTVDPGAVSLL